MSKLNLRGLVLHADLSPMKGAAVAIRDLDEGGNGNDTIFTGTTGNDGWFTGQSAEWLDVNTKKIPLPPPLSGTQTVQIPDVMALEIEVTQGSQKFRAPFIYVSDQVPSPPVHTNIARPKTVVVNGTECGTPAAIASATKAVLASKPQTFEVRLYGPDAPKLLPLGLPEAKLRQKVQGSMAGAVGADDAVVIGAIFGGAALVIVAVSVLIIASGAGAILLAVALAIVATVMAGYHIQKVEMKTDVGPDNNASAYVNVVFEKNA